MSDDTNHTFLMWINTNKCMVRMNDPKLINVLSPSKIQINMYNRATINNGCHIIAGFRSQVVHPIL